MSSTPALRPCWSQPFGCDSGFGFFFEVEAALLLWGLGMVQTAWPSGPFVTGQRAQGHIVMVICHHGGTFQKPVLLH